MPVPAMDYVIRTLAYGLFQPRRLQAITNKRLKFTGELCFHSLMKHLTCMIFLLDMIFL